MKKRLKVYHEEPLYPAWAAREQASAAVASTFCGAIFTGEDLPIKTLQEQLEDCAQAGQKLQKEMVFAGDTSTLTKIGESVSKVDPWQNAPATKNDWTKRELASLLYGVYNFGEGDWKNVLLEDPDCVVSKRSL